MKHDILTFVMYDGQWSPDELQLKREMRQLLWANVLQPKGTFGYLSPHPTVYRAASDGILEIAGHKFHFEAGLVLLWRATARYRVNRSGDSRRVGWMGSALSTKWPNRAR